MKPKIIFGPTVNEGISQVISALQPDFYVLDFTPFQKYCITETTAKVIKKALPAKTKLIGAFSKNPVQQILYLLTENIIDLAFCADCSEKDLLRIDETTKKPLIQPVNHKDPAAIFRVARQTGTYLYFSERPDPQILADLKKPYILGISNEEQARIHLRNEDEGLFAFWCKNTDIEKIQEIINITDAIQKREGNL